MKKLITLIGLLFISFTAFAEDTTFYVGKLTDQGANITVTTNDGKKTYRIDSNLMDHLQIATTSKWSQINLGDQNLCLPPLLGYMDSELRMRAEIL